MNVARRLVLALVTVLPVAALAPGNALAAKPEVFATTGHAIRGYDPVAYFTQRRPVKGKPEYAHKWKGTTWLFANSANRTAFKANPARYAPQYGGYCAYAVSNGYTATTDPDAWTIHGGKLYLNYSKNVRRLWSKDIPGRIKSANGHWPSVLKR